VHRFIGNFSLKILGRITPVQRGTPQGSSLSPLLCIIFLWDMINWLNGKPGAHFRGTIMPWEAVPAVATVIKMLLFADDTTLLSESPEDLQIGLDLLTQWARFRRVLFNIDKSAVMVLAQPRVTIPTSSISFRLQGLELPKVAVFRYLGNCIQEAPTPRANHPRSRYCMKVPLDLKGTPINNAVLEDTVFKAKS